MLITLKSGLVCFFQPNLVSTRLTLPPHWFFATPLFFPYITATLPGWLGGIVPPELNTLYSKYKKNIIQFKTNTHTHLIKTTQISRSLASHLTLKAQYHRRHLGYALVHLREVHLIKKTGDHLCLLKTGLNALVSICIYE